MKTLLFCAFVVFITGCGALPPAQLRGYFGPVAAQGAADANADNENAVTLTLHTGPNGDHVRMLKVLSVDRLTDIESGHHEYTFDPNTLDQQPIEVHVCSSDAPGYWWDEPADRVTVDVSRSDNGVRFTMHTAINNTGETPDYQTTDSAFEVQP